MHIVAIAWIFVAVLMAAAEATSTQGTLLGAFFTLLLYGAMPLAIVLYVLGTPGRKRLRRARELAEATAAAEDGSSDTGDAGGQPAADRLAPERKET